MAFFIIQNPGKRRQFEPYTPGKDLKEQIASHKGLEGSPCEFVECKYETPDFKAFDERQLAFYLYFRGQMLKKSYVQSDDGYQWLFINELINDTEDPKRTMDILKWMYRDWVKRDDVSFAPATISDLMFSYAVANDLDLPQIYTSESIWEKALISEVLLPFPKPIEAGDFSTVVGYPLENYYSELGHSDVLPLFNASLFNVDLKLREATGKGVMDTYGGEERTDSVNLFSSRWKKWYYFGEKRRTLTYRDSGAPLQAFLGAMYRYCVKVIEKELDTGKGPSVAAVFGKDLRRVVDDTYNHGSIRPVAYPEERGRGSVRRMPGEVMIPVVNSSGESHHSLSSHFKKDILTYSVMGSSGPCPYVPSGYREPEYTCLSPNALRYYLYWRECARQGRYGETDRGYLWLYMCELINSSQNTYETLDRLAGLARAYDRFFGFEMFGSTDKPGRTYLDFAFINGIRIPDPSVFPCYLSACDMMEAILDGEDIQLCKDNFMMLAEISSDKASTKNLYAAFNDDCTHILASALYMINDSGKGRRVTSYCRIRSKTIKMDVFPRLKFYYWPGGRQKMPQRDVTNFMENKTFAEELKELVKTVAAFVRDGKKPKPKAVFGVDVSDIIVEAAAEWYDTKAKASGIEKARNLVLDAGALEAAKSDLDRVTEMMSTEQEDVAPVEEEKVSDKPSGDPWKAFADRLNKGQREYLRKVVAGTLRVPKAVTEDAINSIAMDTVGDTVVEDGRPVEEYVQELSGVVSE